MEDSKKLVLGGITAVLMVIAAIVVFKSFGSGGDTTTQAQLEAQKIAQSSHPNAKIPDEQYKTLMSGAVGAGGRIRR
jgi:hypothetical protein